MSRLIKSVLAVSVLVPGMALAGYHAYGNVSVNSYATYVALQGNMSVRYNPSASTNSTYVYATGYAGQTVGFHGRDGDGEYFSCHVPSSSPLYQAAVDIKNNLQDGSRLYVTRDLSSSLCTNVFLGNYSYYQE